MRMNHFPSPPLEINKIHSLRMCQTGQLLWRHYEECYIKLDPDLSTIIRISVQ